MAGENLTNLNDIHGKKNSELHPQDNMKVSAKGEIADVFNSRPEPVWVESKQSAKLSIEPGKPGPWQRKYSSDSETLPGISRDTISVIERPIVDNINKELEFPRTVAGVIYKIHKSEKIGNETTWVEVPNLSFVGDGKAHIVDPGNGDFRVGVTRPGREEVIDKETISLDGVE